MALFFPSEDLLALLKTSRHNVEISSVYQYVIRRLAVYLLS